MKDFYTFYSNDMSTGEVDFIKCDIDTKIGDVIESDGDFFTLVHIHKQDESSIDSYDKDIYEFYKSTPYEILIFKYSELYRFICKYNVKNKYPNLLNDILFSYNNKLYK